ncbi:MAG: DUF6291 domain-containing protein [Oscillospiraceae bacterium]|nr:DUF6291 domain-containing protein [Oscillospiraceae bacterium]
MIFYYDWIDYLEMLGQPALALSVLQAVVRFAQTGEAGHFEQPAAEIVFQMMSKQTGRDAEKYRRICKKRSDSARKSHQKLPPAAFAAPAADPVPESDPVPKSDPVPESVPESDPQAGPVQAGPSSGGAQKTAPLSAYREAFLRACPSFPQPANTKEWSAARKKRLLEKKLTPDKMETVFRRAEASDFLSGRSGKWSGCSLDWLLSPQNWQKLLEGNYDNRRPVLADKDKPSFDLDAYERDSLAFWQRPAF